MTADGLTLDQLRSELRNLVALADTSERPKPTAINPPEHPMPGHEWTVGDGRAEWTVRAVDDPDLADCVYVNTPDAMFPSDFQAMTILGARQLAMALRAACDRADHLRPGVPRLADRGPA